MPPTHQNITGDRRNAHCFVEDTVKRRVRPGLPLLQFLGKRGARDQGRPGNWTMEFAYQSSDGQAIDDREAIVGDDRVVMADIDFFDGCKAVGGGVNLEPPGPQTVLQ